MVSRGKRQKSKGKRSYQPAVIPTAAGKKADSRQPIAEDFFSRFIYYLLLTACCLLSIPGCDESFQPFQENDRYFFSIYGYLDASADTQWVRVAPARQQLNMPPVVPEIRVTLEHLQSGDTAVMNDSLVVPGSGFNYLNFWTTMDIVHSQTYRLIAERPDGATSQVTVTTPEELPTPRLRRETGFGRPVTYTLYVDDNVEHLVDVQTKWYVRVYSSNFEERKVFSFSHRNKAVRIQAYGGAYSFFIEPAREMEQILAESQALEIQVLHRQIYVAAGGPEWDDGIASLSDLVYALPGGFSNVENGLGYMVGIDSKIIPFESCFDEQAALVSCPEEEPYW